MYAIQNRMKRTWAVPAVTDVASRMTHYKSIQIEPGDTALVAEEHWDHVKKGNRVIDSLLSARHLVVTGASKVQDVHVDELSNPAPPKAPEELTDKDDRVKLETKTELKEVSLDDGPKEGKGPRK